MPTALGFGPIKDDDELLDRLGSRSSDASDGLEGLFASWTASIDEDERVGAREIGPLGLRRVDLGDDSVTPIAPRTRVVRVPRSRAVALVGALALTLSGGGVAAALTQVQSPLVTKAIQKATEPITGGLVALAAQPGPTTPTSSPTVEAALEMVEKARQAASNGEVAKAMGMMEVIRSLVPKDNAGEQVTAEVDKLEREISSSAPGPVLVADAPSKHAESTTESLVTVAPTKTAAAPTVVNPTTANAPAVPPSPTTAPTNTSPSKPSTTKPSDPGSTTVPGTASPTQTPATTGPSIGHSGGEQKPGTGTATSPAGDTSEGTRAPDDKPSDIKTSAGSPAKPGSATPTSDKPSTKPDRGESNGSATDLGAGSDHAGGASAKPQGADNGRSGGSDESAASTGDAEND